jgi:drug/metabolite transporter (DMT)-like permease
MQPEEARMQLEARYRTMVILWAALLLSVGLYFALSVFVAKPDSEDTPSRTLTFVLTAVGVFLVIVSFAVKQKFLAQAEQNQAPSLVQTGLIIALAFCEGAALLGLLDFFATGNRYYFVTFIVALVGMLLHFPRRDQLAAASYRQPDEVRGT